MPILHKIAQIESCYPFRGTIPEASDGDSRVVQMKDVNPHGDINWESSIRTHLKGRKPPQWLESGDVLFLARGSRNIAICLDRVPECTVCSPHFYKIKVKSDVSLLPDFLAWQLNQEYAQAYFSKSAEGKIQSNIRKAILEETEIVIPPLDLQEQTIELDYHINKEKRALLSLIDNRRLMMNAVAKKILVTK